MTEWIKYTGSDEQIAEMKTGFIYRNKSGAQSDLILTASHFISSAHLINHLNNIETTHILICATHPYADMICQWARTGQPVYWKRKGDSSKNQNWSCDFIPWNKHDIYEYSFTPFED